MFYQLTNTQYIIINFGPHAVHYYHLMTYFIAGSLYFLTSFIHSPTPIPPKAKINLFFVSKNSFLLNSTYNCDHKVIVYVSLILLSIMPSRFIHIVLYAKILFYFFMTGLHVCLCVWPDSLFRNSPAIVNAERTICATSV